MIKYIAIAGTWGANKSGDWFNAGSPFNNMLAENGAELLVTNPLNRYMWSTDVDGIDGEDNTWDAAGRALAHYIVPPLLGKSLVKPEDTFLIAHSHGGNVVAYACGKYGLKVNGLITIGTPVRKELYPIYADAASNITRHLHLYAGWKDYMQVLGALFDGRFGIHRKHPYATRNEKMPQGHGDMLRKTELFPLWKDRGWLKFWMGV